MTNDHYDIEKIAAWWQEVNHGPWPSKRTELFRLSLEAVENVQYLLEEVARLRTLVPSDEPNTVQVRMNFAPDDRPMLSLSAPPAWPEATMAELLAERVGHVVRNQAHAATEKWQEAQEALARAALRDWEAEGAIRRAQEATLQQVHALIGRLDEAAGLLEEHSKGASAPVAKATRAFLRAHKAQGARCDGDWSVQPLADALETVERRERELLEAKEALLHYAKEENWKCPRDEQGGYSQAPAQDCGRLARQTLERLRARS